MSEFSGLDKRKFEKLFDMSTGYVMDFSNRTFQEYIFDTLNIDIYDPKYEYASCSKANMLRGFWKVESNYNISRLNDALLDYWKDMHLLNNKEIKKADEQLYEECRKINLRLKEESFSEHIEAIEMDSEEQDFSILSESIKESINKNQPEAALDRLHTFVVKFIRQLCDKHNIKYDKQKPLHSFYGEYVKYLKSNNLIDSEMTLRILKTSISIMESFNKVRNDKSLAHDNEILNYNESMLIFKNIANIINFIKEIETDPKEKIRTEEDLSDELPF